MPCKETLNFDKSFIEKCKFNFSKKPIGIKVKSLINKNFDAEPVYPDKYLKNKKNLSKM